MRCRNRVWKRGNLLAVVLHLPRYVEIDAWDVGNATRCRNTCLGCWECHWDVTRMLGMVPGMLEMSRGAEIDAWDVGIRLFSLQERFFAQKKLTSAKFDLREKTAFLHKRSSLLQNSLYERRQLRS